MPEAPARLKDSAMFSPVVTEFWNRSLATGTLICDDGRSAVVVTENLSRGAELLSTEDGRDRMALSAAAAEAAGVTPGAESLVQVRERLAAAEIILDDAAELHYWPDDAAAALRAEVPQAQVRPLTAADSDRFAAFTAACSPADLDEAEVTLADWQVLGIGTGEQLMAVASALRWGESRIADLGVLTHPDHRREGHARALVRAFGARLLAAGYEPQYRCDPANTASAAVARSAGLARLGTWTTTTDG